MSTSSIPQNNGRVNPEIDALLNGALKAPAGAAVPMLPASARLDPALAHGVAPWLDAYIAHSRIWAPEAYENYHEAAALWLLSTVAARRVAIDLGKRHYTNLYIALVGRTSVFTKSTCAAVGRSVLRAAGLDYLLTPDEMTPQAFIDELSARELPANFDLLTPASQERCRARLPFAGQRGWYYDELGQKVDGMMRDGGYMGDYRGLLRSLDNADDEYTYVSRGDGRNTIERPYLALLGSVTPADLRKWAGRGARLWNDGFWARFAFICPPGDASPKSARWPNKVMEIAPALSGPLRQWHTRLGVPPTDQPVRTPSLTADDATHEAFYAYRDALKTLVSQNDTQDLDGNYARLPEKALRVAGLLASLDGRRTVGLPHWARAQQIAERWRSDLHNLYNQLTGEVEANRERTIEDGILQRLAQRGPMSARDLARHIHVSSAELQPILRAMCDAESIHEQRDGKTAVYTVPVHVESRMV